MPCASFSMLDGPGGTGCDVPVRGCLVSRDVIVAAELIYYGILPIFPPSSHPTFVCFFPVGLSLLI